MYSHTLSEHERKDFAARILRTLPTGMRRVDLYLRHPNAPKITKPLARELFVRFGYRGDGTTLVREKPVSAQPPTLTRRLSILRRFDENPWRHEVQIPLLFGTLVLGWVVAPFPSVGYWTRCVRDSWRSHTSTLAGQLGTSLVESGRIPPLAPDTGDFLRGKAFVDTMHFMADTGEVCTVASYRPDKPEFSENAADLLNAVVREGDTIGVSNVSAGALCVGGSDDVATRLMTVARELVALDCRLAGELRLMTVSGGRSRAKSAYRIAPSVDPVNDHRIEPLGAKLHRIIGESNQKRNPFHTVGAGSVSWGQR